MSKPDDIEDDDWTNATDAPLPKPGEFCIPFGWRIVLMPRRMPEKTSGGIIVPQIAQSNNDWLTYVAQIAALGPLAYKHEKYRKMGLSEADMPKVGEWWLYQPYAPYRLQFRNRKFIVLNDDSLIARVPDGVDPWDFKAGMAE